MKKKVKTMSDIINRADAITAVAVAVLDDRDELEALRALPSAEANDRPHGKWVTVNSLLDVYICDQCGEIYQIQNIPLWHFCPNCGADNRGECDAK